MAMTPKQRESLADAGCLFGPVLLLFGLFLWFVVIPSARADDATAKACRSRGLVAVKRYEGGLACVQP